jgi:hypothetical protein
MPAIMIFCGVGWLPQLVHLSERHLVARIVEEALVTHRCTLPLVSTDPTAYYWRRGCPRARMVHAFVPFVADLDALLDDPGRPSIEPWLR